MIYFGPTAAQKWHVLKTVIPKWHPRWPPNWVMSQVISGTISDNNRALHTLVKVVLKIIIIRSLTCTTAGMIESVVTLAPANVQQTKALVLKCCRVGWTHWLLVRRAVVITNTTGIKCRESFADGMVIASNVCARVYIFRAKKQQQNQHLYE